MPILEDEDMIHRAVLWVRQGEDASGQPSYREPVEVWCSWSWRRTRSVGADGTPIALDATAMLGQGVVEELTDASTHGARSLPGAKVWLAADPTEDALAQWYGTGSAGQETGLMQVATVSQVWDSKGIEMTYTLGLTWYRDAE